MCEKRQQTRKNFLLFLSLLLWHGIAYAQETFNEETAYQQMYRVIARPSEDANSECDVYGFDHGSSDFVRQLFNMNELTSDMAVYCREDIGWSSKERV